MLARIRRTGNVYKVAGQVPMHLTLGNRKVYTLLVTDTSHGQGWDLSVRSGENIYSYLKEGEKYWNYGLSDIEIIIPKNKVGGKLL